MCLILNFQTSYKKNDMKCCVTAYVLILYIGEFIWRYSRVDTYWWKVVYDAQFHKSRGYKTEGN